MESGIIIVKLQYVFDFYEENRINNIAADNIYIVICLVETLQKMNDYMIQYVY